MIEFQDETLSAAEAERACQERVERIAGECDRVRIDCDLPYLAEVCGLAAAGLASELQASLQDTAGGADVAPRVLASLDALIRDLSAIPER